MRNDDPQALPGQMTIRPRPLIVWLGALLGLVAGAPAAIGCIVLACRPSYVVEYPMSVPFSVMPAVGIGWITYRWLTIRGTADEHEMYLRGWFKTLIMPTASVATVRRIEVETTNDHGTSRTPQDILVDHEGHSLGTIPAALAICPDWKPFLAHLRRLAAASRSRGPAAAAVPRPLEDIPVSEWTLEDIECSERRG